MAETNEARLPLTAASVQAWARQNFPKAFGALPRISRLTWIGFDETRFVNNSNMRRSIGRSSHKQLLVIGAYEPGLGILQEPTDRVVAHLHVGEAALTFHRIARTPKGEEELLPVTSTSDVAFHAPFCDVGDATGGSDAIHRVSALISYFFLAAKHVHELVRSPLDPTMFTRNFRSACLWVESGGERPATVPPRRSSGAITTLQGITTRSMRSTSITVLSPKSPSISRGPTIKRSATDSITSTPKPEQDEGAATRPKRLRTLSEPQPHISSSQDRGSLRSPRRPPRDQIFQALTDRINSLKDEKEELEEEKEDLKTRLAAMEKRLTTVDERVTVELAAIRTDLARIRGESARK